MLDLLAYGAFFATTALTFAVMSLGLNVQWGETGLFNVGVAGFAAAGAYATAFVTTPAGGAHWGGYDWPIPVGLAAATGVAALLSTAVGALTLRLRSDYLAITTFGLAVVAQLGCLNLQGVTGGPFGIGFIPRPFAAWADRPLAFALAQFAVTGTIVGAVCLVLHYLSRSPWGRVLRAIRDDDTATAALGKNATAYRLQAFALGGGLIGLGGALQAHVTGFIAPDNYLPALTFQVWTMLIVGGTESVAGPVLGALLVWALWTGSGAALTALVPPEFQARAAALQVMAIGIALCAILVVRPRGLVAGRATAARKPDIRADDPTEPLPTGDAVRQP